MILLEVGLGGRLDATNIIDSDVAVLTSIDLDHQQWLGETRSEIAYEKLGIARPNKPLIIGETDYPQNFQQLVIDTAAAALWHGQNFDYQLQETSFIARLLLDSKNKCLEIDNCLFKAFCLLINYLHLRHLPASALPSLRQINVELHWVT